MKTSRQHFVILEMVVLLLFGVSTIGASQPRVPADFKHYVDSLRLTGEPRHTFDDILKRNGHHNNLNAPRNVVSPQSPFYVIDTAIVRGTSDTTRHLCSFNAGGKRTCDLTQKLTGDLWVDTMRHTNTYDESNNLLTDVYEYWSNSQWVNWYRYTYTYDANKNILAQLGEGWSNGQWVNEWRDTYTYDANGNMLTYLQETWWDGQWVGDWRDTYTYDANGNMLTYVQERWSNGQWANGERRTCTYDANGKMLTYLRETWWDGQWVRDWRWTYTYDANGNLLTYVQETWSNSQWANGGRRTCTYDANGNMLTELYELWSNSQWVNWYRYTYTYDANGNMLTDLYETWSIMPELNEGRCTYTYDAQGILTSLSYHLWVNSSWTPADGGNIRWAPMWYIADSASNIYLFKAAYNVTLTRKLILTEVLAEGKNVPELYRLSQNYPNPFNPSTTIEFALPSAGFVTLKVYNVLGEEVASLIAGENAAGTFKATWDASGLPSGVYFYRLTAGKYVQTRKAVLAK